jgi:lipopolysaccharide biosynthesis regulator YciM
MDFQPTLPEAGDRGQVPSPTEKGIPPETALPPEMLQEIFGKLGAQDLSSTTTVDKTWQAHVITKATSDQNLLVKSLINAIVTFLQVQEKSAPADQKQTYKDQILKMQSLHKSNNVLESINLIQIKNNLNSLRDVFIQNLNGVSEDDLKKLKTLLAKQKMPQFFANLIEVALVNKEIEKAIQQTDPNVKNFRLRELIQELSGYGEVDRTIELALSSPHALPDGDNKWVALSAIVAALSKKGQYDRAVEIANKLPSNQKTGALREIAVSYAKRGDFDKAIATVDEIPSEEKKTNALKEIIREVIEKGLLDKAYEIAKRMPKIYLSSDSLKELARRFVEKGNLNKVIEAAKAITDESYKSDFLFHLLEIFAEKGDLDRAQEAALAQPNEERKSSGLNTVAGEFLKRKELEKAYEIVNKVTSSLKDVGLRDIAVEFIKSGDLKRASEVGRSISDPDEQSYVVYNVCRKFIENDEFDRAVETAYELQLSSFRFNAFKDVVTALVKKGNVDKAIEIANAIPGILKSRVLQTIEELKSNR